MYSKSRKFVSIGYFKGEKENHLWNPTINKLVINGDAIFVKDEVEIEENNTILKETTTIHIRNIKDYNDLNSFKDILEYKENK